MRPVKAGPGAASGDTGWCCCPGASSAAIGRAASTPVRDTATVYTLRSGCGRATRAAAACRALTIRSGDIAAATAREMRSANAASPTSTTIDGNGAGTIEAAAAADATERGTHLRGAVEPSVAAVVAVDTGACSRGAAGYPGASCANLTSCGSDAWRGKAEIGSLAVLAAATTREVTVVPGTCAAAAARTDDLDGVVAVVPIAGRGKGLVAASGGR